MKFIIDTYLNEEAIQEAIGFFHDAHESDFDTTTITPFIEPTNVNRPPPVSSPLPPNPAPEIPHTFYWYVPLTQESYWYVPLTQEENDWLVNCLQYYEKTPIVTAILSKLK